MTKEENKVVKEVEIVLEVVKKYLDQKQDMPYKLLEEILEKLNEIKEDYNKTISDLLVSNSLVVRLEQLLEVIDTISTISVEDEDKFKKFTSCFDETFESIKG